MPAMSPSEEANKGDDPEFKWGKKRGVGGPKKDNQFYESFTYDGVNYSLYDCAYLHKEGEPEPYIGKLVKIWEQPNHKKKIKVLWFFRPIEILNWLGGDKVLDNEIFLASGEGVGLANINPLEVLVGKCNVICTSKDERNPQPSEEDIKTADYIFFRTFDVGNCTISDSVNDKIGGIEVRYVFNQKDVIKPTTVSKLEASQSDENEKVVASNRISFSLSKLDSPVALNIVSRDEKADHEAGLDSNVIVGTAVKQEEPFSDEKTVQTINTDASNSKTSKIAIRSVEDKEKLKAIKDSDFLDNRPSKKARITNNCTKPLDELLPPVLCLPALKHGKNEKSMQKSTVDSDKEYIKASEFLLEHKSKGRPGDDSSILDGRPSKKARFADNSSKPSEQPQPTISHPSTLDKDKPNKKMRKLRVDSDEECDNALEEPVSYSKKSKGQLVEDFIGHDKGTSNKNDEKKDSIGHDKGPSNKKIDEKKDSIGHAKGPSNKKIDEKNDFIGNDKGPSNKKIDEKKAKSSENTLHKSTSAVALEKDSKTDNLMMEVTRRPDADRSKWFKGLPWEERLGDAHEQGTLVLLENLDPCYSSSEIEDIIWHGFKERCTAKVIPRTMFSSLHCGRAFVIFKSKESAEMAVRKLAQGCLMLPNGRPLVGSKGMPIFPGKPSKFAGHLSIDKIKLQMQREEMKKAVSTSHCSQPNTIEYEMAMEWRLLQAKSEIWWKELYKQHGEELRKLRNSLKRK